MTRVAVIPLWLALLTFYAGNNVGFCNAFTVRSGQLQNQVIPKKAVVPSSSLNIFSERVQERSLPPLYMKGINDGNEEKDESSTQEDIENALRKAKDALRSTEDKEPVVLPPPSIFGE